MSTDKGARHGRALHPNLVLIAKREQKGWGSRRRAARELHKLWREQLPGLPSLESLEKALYRHETGRVQVRDEMYRKLYCLAYDASPHELFGAVQHDIDGTGVYTVRSHKFIPAFVGVEAALHLVTDGNLPAAVNQWFDCHTRTMQAPSGQCDLYVWPFGVAMFHLTEDLTLSNLATLALWRRRSYVQNLKWATNEFRRLVSDDKVEASYVLSLYWMVTPAWPGDQLDTALRILCIPKVLLERSVETDDALGHAELVERALLEEGFDHAEIASFGIKGISTGYASWSGVVYHPTAEHRALAESDLVACELAAQSIWAYCGHINNEVEQGRDPVVPSDYNWRFLRAMRSRMVNARPQEDEQHRSMRTAILDTSCVIDHLIHATETLRESNGG